MFQTTLPNHLQLIAWRPFNQSGDLYISSLLLQVEEKMKQEKKMRRPANLCECCTWVLGADLTRYLKRNNKHEDGEEHGPAHLQVAPKNH